MGSDSKPVYSVRVRDLVEFVLRRGDLGGERGFVGSDRALAGTRGHQKLQRSRPPGYKKEVSLTHAIETSQFILRIQGRLDGLFVTQETTVLEEIKTIQGTWDHTADPLHWAQAKCYGFIHAREHGLDRIVLQLTYLELDTAEVTEFREHLSFIELQTFFEATTALYLEWIREGHEWCRTRDESIRSLAFPFSDFRPGQRKLAVAAYRVMAGGGRLFLEAPTGIGKTISILFPAVKALGEGKLERIFYLTARTVGRVIAEKAFAVMRQHGLRLRSVTFTAKEKVCVRDGQPCDASTCPLALGYYDRNKAAMRSALDYAEITRTVLEAVGREHRVCPFELSLDVSSWVDAVICDYNYVFDPKVYLRRHFAEDAGDFGFLVDEAHNLVDRAREMFSADLDPREIQEVRRAIKGVPRCSKALAGLSSAMRALAGSKTLSANPAETTDPSGELNLYPATAALKATRETSFNDGSNEFQISHALPPDLLPLVEKALSEAESWLVKNQPAEFRNRLLELFFRLHSFRRIAELYDERYVTIIESSSLARLRLFCLDPSFLLRQALTRGKSAVFFSATLTPIDYYRALLGGDPEDPVLRLESPFPSGNLAVLVHDRIQTHFKARTASLAEVTEAIVAALQQRQGNYMVYFPSYKYLTSVQAQFQSFQPATRIIVQRPGMTESERDAFLAAFRVEHSETLVGFAVMGGIFGEGIDLVGEHLIGAIIVGTGLPQLTIERDLIRNYFESRTGDGFGYAYTFPGMNRVLQAVGRVIRSETDRGVALLIDTRFSESRYRRLFPAWWRVSYVRNVAGIRETIRSFWESARTGSGETSPR
jgi:DNA excision repair protein ERCC-2